MDATVQPKPTRGRRIRRWISRIAMISALLLLTAAIGIWYWGGAYAQRVIESKLQEIVAGHLNAQLTIGKIDYDYPYGVTVDGASLITSENGKPVTLASFKSLRLQLQELPFKKGPLRIERIELQEPTVHLIRTPTGFVGEQNLVKSDEESRKKGAPRLSDVFVLRYLKLVAAKVQYEDTRPATDGAPMVWHDLNIEIHSQPQGASYAFEFAGATGDMAQINSKGSANIDSLTVDLDLLRIETRLFANQRRTALPPEVQQVLQRFGVAGRAKAEVSGKVLFRDPHASNVKLQFSIEDGQAILPGVPDTLQDVDLSFSASFAEGEINAKIDHFVVRSGSTAMSVLPFNVLYTIDTRRWTAAPISLAAAYIPTDQTRPILDQPATLSLSAQAEQTGDFDQFAVRLDGTSLSLPNLNETLRLYGQLALDTNVIALNPSTLEGLGGKIELSGWLDRRSLYARAQAEMKNLSLAAIKVLLEPKTEKELKGRLTGDAIVGIDRFNLDTLTGNGRVRVTEGQFAKVPVLSGIARFIGFGEGMFVAESAYARFTIEQQKLKLQRVAVSTTAMRVRGEGEVGFDQKLDLKVYVTGTGDWGKSLKSTGIPVISDVAGALAGGTQSVIRGVTSQFTSLKVTGNVQSPKITPDPAPVITDGIQRLFNSDER